MSQNPRNPKLMRMACTSGNLSKYDTLRGPRSSLDGGDCVPFSSSGPGRS